MSPPTDSDAHLDHLISTTGLVAGYGGTPVVHGVDLELGAGEVVALLGANGAGKTTTLLTLSGLLPIIGGSAWVLGTELPRRRRSRPSDISGTARRGVAHVPEDRGLFFDLTAAENLRLGRPGRFRRRGGQTEPLPMDQVMEWFPALANVLDRRAGLLSGGEQQMLALARAVMSRPKVLMVDEMSLGLAPLVVESLLPVLRSIAHELGSGVLLVEQHVALVLSVSDRAYVLQHGRVVLSGAAADVAAQTEQIESGYLGTVESD